MFTFQFLNDKNHNYVSFAQFVYFLREVCLLSNFQIIKFTIMSKKHNCGFYHSKNRKINILPSKNIQTEQNWYIFLSFWGNERRKKPKYFAPQLVSITGKPILTQNMLIKFLRKKLEIWQMFQKQILQKCHKNVHFVTRWLALQMIWNHILK